MELVHKRQHGAVPIVVQGAKFHRVNGCYEPVDEVRLTSSLFLVIIFLMVRSTKIGLSTAFVEIEIFGWFMLGMSGSSNQPKTKELLKLM